MKKIKYPMILVIALNIFVFGLLLATKFISKQSNKCIYRQVYPFKRYAYNKEFMNVPALIHRDDTILYDSFFGEEGIKLNTLVPPIDWLPLDRPIYVKEHIGGHYYEVYHFDTCCWGSRNGIVHERYLHLTPIPLDILTPILNKHEAEKNRLDRKYGPRLRNKIPPYYGWACW